MSETVPESWSFVCLGDYAHIKARIGWRGLSSSEYTTTGPYLIAGKHLQRSSINWSKCDHISEERYEESIEIQLQEADIIISKDGTIGRLGYVQGMPGKATINGTMMLIRPSADFHSKFIYFYLQGEEFQKVVREKVSGSSIPHIFQRDMVSLNVPLAPLPEQKKIASILTSVDEVIETTQKQIDKLQDLKKATMNELLTKGIGHTEFKDSELGRIPKSWKVVRLGDYSIIKGGKRLPKGSDFSENPTPFPYIRVSDLKNGSVNTNNLRFVSEKVREHIKRYTISKEDLYVSIAGSIGIVGTIPSELDGALLTENAAKIVIKSEAIHYLFLYYLMNSLMVQSQFHQETGTGGGVPKLALFRIEGTTFSLPKISEQHRIANVLQSLDGKLDMLVQKITQTQSLKKSLMQDLLTGKVRVQVN